MRLMIAIDGACRRNGKPDCTASGGVFIQVYDDNMCRIYCKSIAVHEYCSTNQRGELLALLEALKYIATTDAESYIITDSEYIFNAMTKPWYTNWINNNWCTRAGEEVKNKDIWMNIVEALNDCTSEIVFYHIKGHCIPFGKVTAGKILDTDSSGMLLADTMKNRFDEIAHTKQKVFDAALELSERNNMFKPTNEIFKEWVVANGVADAIATKEVDAADQWS